MSTNQIRSEAARNATRWHKSSYSQNSGGSCLEAASLPESIAIRDSKLPTTGDFPVLVVPTTDWTALLITVACLRSQLVHV